MWDRVFNSSTLTFLAFTALLGILAGLATGRRRREGTAGILGRCVEAAVLAPLGGLLARAFMTLLLTAGGDSSSAALVVGWSFFLWPGAVDTLLALLHCEPIFTPAVLAWSATVVGAFVGLMDGLHRVHSWRGPGALLFVLDVTWGLAGSTNGCLLHLANLLLRAHRDAAPHQGAHRYLDGFRFKAGFAVTLGAVMSNVPAHAHDLVRHERQHVLQNRLFGPLYTLTYLGWMALMLLPALAAGAATGSPGRTIEDWCYLNNPWELWAYTQGGWRDPRRLWNGAVQMVTAVLFFLIALAVVLGFVQHVWLP
jgi:hypothetical protein